MNQSVSQTGHPKGLWVLFATEMWERFNYYGMRAILTYFMTQALLFNTEFSNGLYGSYISLLYLTPLVGGYIADRYWGNKRSILVGGLVMALGELILFVCASIYDSSRDMANILFFSGLGFMIAGNGFFKANISSLVGQLYPKGDLRVDPAYTIFYMGINVGATLGPILCGYFGDTGDPSDFKWAFLVAGIGMLFSVLIQKLFHDKYVRTPEGEILGLTPGTDNPSNNPLIPASSFVKAPSKIWANPVFIIVGLLAFSALMIGVIYLDTRINYLFYLLTASFVFIVYLIQSDKSLNKEEKQRVWVMVIIAFFVMFFWGAYEQTGSTLALFARDQTDRTIFGWEMPASFFQSFNAAFIIIFAPAFAWLWLKMGKSQPATPTKMGIGLILLAFGFLWIAIGAKSGETKTVSMIWLTGLYLLHTWGELCLSPIGLSLFNKLSPLKFASLLMAVWFLGNAGGNKLVGVLGALYPKDGNTTNFLGYQMNNLYDFFMLFVFMGGTAGVILLLLSKKLQKMMHGIV